MLSATGKWAFVRQAENITIYFHTYKRINTTQSGAKEDLQLSHTQLLLQVTLSNPEQLNGKYNNCRKTCRVYLFDSTSLHLINHEFKVSTIYWFSLKIEGCWPHWSRKRSKISSCLSSRWRDKNNLRVAFQEFHCNILYTLCISSTNQRII